MGMMRSLHKKDSDLTAAMLEPKILCQDVQTVAMHHSRGTVLRPAHDILTIRICESTPKHVAGGSKLDA